MHLTSRQRKIAKWVGYPILAIFTFVFTLAYTFPYDRLKDKIIEGFNDKYDVSIVAIEPSLIPGSFTIKSMSLRTRPKTADEKPVTVYIEEIDVNVGVLSAVFWTIDMAKIGVEVEAKIGSGSLGLEIEHEKGSNTLAFNAKTDRLPIASMPGVAEAVGLPMTGGLTASLNVTLPNGKWSKAEGKAKLNCLGCTVGDGVAKMKMKPPTGSNPRRRRKALFQSEGLTVPKLMLGAVQGEVVIKGGKGEIKTLSAKSKDGFLKIEGDIDFKDPFKETLFPGCMTFGFSDELKEREPKFMGIEAGLPPKSKQADGSYALPTKGKLVELRFDVRRQCGQKSRDATRGANRERPRISTTDKDEDKVEPRKMPELGEIKDKEPAADEPKDENKDESTDSGPKLSKGYREIEARAKALDEEEAEEADSEAEETDEAESADEAEGEGGDQEEGEEESEEGEGEPEGDL